jgi:hypothetical protein
MMHLLQKYDDDDDDDDDDDVQTSWMKDCDYCLVN